MYAETEDMTFENRVARIKGKNSLFENGNKEKKNKK